MTIIKTFLAAGVFSGFLLAGGPCFGEDAKTEKDSDPMQFARGAKAWAEQCGRCHNLRAAPELNDHDWHVSVTHMRVRANIPGDIARDILVFLKASNDKKK